MAPVYDFRHVELDKIGRGKRIVKPPGGECSNIFGDEGAKGSPGSHVTPRKTNNYMQSTIFSPDSPDCGGQNGHHHHSPATTPCKPLDTQDRLFGASDDDITPRKVVNRQRSSIFEAEVGDSRPSSQKSTPVRRAPINPITGEPVFENGGSNGSTPNGYHNGGSHNGYSNGGISNGYANGYTNGHSSPESPLNGSSPRVRNPPGGKCSGIF